MARSIESEVQRDLLTAARVLRESGAREVYVFGSAADGTVTPDSDIDLAVKGLAPELFFLAAGKLAMEMSRPFDLIDADEPSQFTDYLFKKGKLRRVA